MSPKIINSVYIYNIDINIKEKNIHDTLTFYDVGKPKCIKIFESSTDIKTTQTAIVDFDEIYQPYLANMETCFSQNLPFIFNLAFNNYWKVFPNNSSVINPNIVEEHEQQIKTLVENQKLMQEQMNLQKGFIERQTEIIINMNNELENKKNQISGIQTVIKTLIENLHESDTQSSIIQHYNHTLYSKDGIYPLFNPEESFWPTTRQGDSHSIQLGNIKRVISNLLLENEMNNSISKEKSDYLFNMLYRKVDDEDYYISSPNDTDDELFTFNNSNTEKDFVKYPILS